jgi:aconitate hydratase
VNEFSAFGRAKLKGIAAPVLCSTPLHIARLTPAHLGILPLTFANPADYDKISQDDPITAANVREAVREGKEDLIVKVRDEEIPVTLKASDREREILAVGGLINLAAKSKNES